MRLDFYRIYQIVDVLDRDLAPKTDYKYRIGREGRFENLNHGTPMFFEYTNAEGILVTSNVEDINTKEAVIVVTTDNSIYKFKEVKGK